METKTKIILGISLVSVLLFASLFTINQINAHPFSIDITTKSVEVYSKIIP